MYDKANEENTAEIFTSVDWVDCHKDSSKDLTLGFVLETQSSLLVILEKLDNIIAGIFADVRTLIISIASFVRRRYK